MECVFLYTHGLELYNNGVAENGLVHDVVIILPSETGGYQKHWNVEFFCII